MKKRVEIFNMLQSDVASSGDTYIVRDEAKQSEKTPAPARRRRLQLRALPLMHMLEQKISYPIKEHIRLISRGVHEKLVGTGRKRKSPSSTAPLEQV